MDAFYSSLEKTFDEIRFLFGKQSGKKGSQRENSEPCFWLVFVQKAYFHRGEEGYYRGGGRSLTLEGGVGLSLDHRNEPSPPPPFNTPSCLKLDTVHYFGL